MKYKSKLYSTSILSKDIRHECFVARQQWNTEKVTAFVHLNSLPWQQTGTKQLREYLNDNFAT